MLSKPWLQLYMEFLREYVEDKIGSKIEDSEWDREFSFLFTKQTFSKGEDLLCSGDICDIFYYISSGVVRTYSIDTKGDEQTWALHINVDSLKVDMFAGDYHSFFTKNSSDFFAEAFSDVVVYSAKFSDLNTLFEKSLNWMRFGKSIFEEQMILFMERKKMMKNLTAKERYLVMKEIAPFYEEILADYQFATVIGIAPQSLSRIKGELRKIR